MLKKKSFVSISQQRRIIMSQSITSEKQLFSGHASLAALAAQMKARGIFEEMRNGMKIVQKIVKDSPQDKVVDILMTLLCGAHSLVQINTLLRADPARHAQHWTRAVL